jgi:hypothetical protein
MIQPVNEFFGIFPATGPDVGIGDKYKH